LDFYYNSFDIEIVAPIRGHLYEDVQREIQRRHTQKS